MIYRTAVAMWVLFAADVVVCAGSFMFTGVTVGVLMLVPLLASVACIVAVARVKCWQSRMSGTESPGLCGFLLLMKGLSYLFVIALLTIGIYDAQGR